MMLSRFTISPIATLLFAVALTLLLASIWYVPSAQAQGAAGIGMSPAMIEPSERLQPGETITRSIEIRNLESQERTLYIIPRNIVRFEAGGTPIFADMNTESTGLELIDWITVSDAQVTIAGNGAESITVTIAIPEDAPPGSHFGSLYISAEAPRLRQSGAGIAYGVANIIALVVDGETETRATIRSFSTDKFFYGEKDVTFEARVENTGNVLVQPVGPLEVRNMFGGEVTQLTVNEQRARVVPGNNRTFRVQWSEDTPGFGRYEALVSLAYESDAGTRTMSSTVSFWILPMNIILPAAGILLVLLLLVYGGIKLYVRRAITMQGGSTRRLARQRRHQGMPVGLLLLIVMLTVTALFLILLLVLFA